MLDNLFVQDYLLKIRTIIDALASIGDHIPCSRHIDVILVGLFANYASVVSAIESKLGLVELDEVEFCC